MKLFSRFLHSRYFRLVPTIPIAIAMILVVLIGIVGLVRDLASIRQAIISSEINQARSHAERTAGRLERELGDGSSLASYRDTDWLLDHWRRTIVGKPDRLYAALVDSDRRIVVHSRQLEQNWTSSETVGANGTFEPNRLAPDWNVAMLRDFGPQVFEVKDQSLTNMISSIDVSVPILNNGTWIGSYHAGIESEWLNQRVRDGQRTSIRGWSIVITLIVAIVLVSTISLYQLGVVESELFGFVKGAFTGASEGRQGRFLAANKGTLFMDEIGDLPPSIQPKLLRVLEQFAFAPVGTNEEQKVDVRLIAATSRNLAEMVERHEFRIDLYHRLNVLAIELPPLRQRPEDIPQLVSFFLRDCSKRHLRSTPNISKEVMDFLIQYQWPGNVRQLRNAIETMVVMSRNEELTRAHLPSYLSGGKVGPSELVSQIPCTLDELEKVAIQNALKRSMGNRTHAAQNLGISVRTLQRKIKQSGVDG